jgi:hypothetical protein
MRNSETTDGVQSRGLYTNAREVTRPGGKCGDETC